MKILKGAVDRIVTPSFDSNSNVGHHNSRNFIIPKHIYSVDWKEEFQEFAVDTQREFNRGYWKFYIRSGYIQHYTNGYGMVNHEHSIELTDPHEAYDSVWHIMCEKEVFPSLYKSKKAFYDMLEEYDVLHTITETLKKYLDIEFAYWGRS